MQENKRQATHRGPAVAWVDSVDAANVALVAPTIDAADVVVGATELDWPA